MRRQQWLGTVVLGSILLFGCQGSKLNAQAKKALGNQAPITHQKVTPAPFPDFTVKGLDGKEKALKDYRGKILILDLFATWCPPCRMEIPHFVELQNKYKDDLAVVGLSYDKDSAEKVKEFMAEMKMNYDVYWGSEEIARHVGLRGIPHTLVIDRQGMVVQSYIGYRDKSVFENAILSLLKNTTDTNAAPAAKE